MLTVISWYSARKSRKQLHQLVQTALTDKPTVLAIVSDHYTNQDNLRPFAPVAERLGDRVHFILVAEYDLCTLRHNRPQSSSMTRTASPRKRGSLPTNDSGH